MTERIRSRILIVDDDAALSEMLQIVLGQEGFDTVHCASGTNALATLRDSRPDLVLLDLMLPGRDGVTVCRDIRTESDVPIVMLTAYTARLAQLLDPHCDILLVGDSLGQVVYGLPSTVPVTRSAAATTSAGAWPIA